MLLDGKLYAEYRINDLRNRVNALEKKPHLIILQVDGDPASDKYVANKMKRCREVGIKCGHMKFSRNTDNDTIAMMINMYNNDPDVTGILLQLPLPAHLDEHYLTNLIAPEKDVDGFTVANAGRLAVDMDCNVACTPKGIIDMLKFYNIPLEGKDVVIINRSNIVGKPLAQLFLKENATVTIAHSKSRGLAAKIFRADIVVTAVGKPGFLNERNFSNGTTIIDVSINFVDGKMCGDIPREDAEILAHRCNITPVPGGVGQTTVIALIENLIEMLEK